MSDKVYQQMGNKQSRASRLPTFKKENWHMVTNAKFSRPEYGLCYLYRNNLTSQQVDEYQIYFHNSAEYEKYLEFFEWRQRQDSIVNSKYINSEEVKQFCNTNHSARIYIEHIPIRLSHIEDIPYPQNLYVLLSALDGFEKIFFWVGYFTPTEDMICVDGDGKVKVWLNPDLSKCHTIDSQFTDQSSNYQTYPQYQEQMASEIVEMVERNTSEQVEASMTFTQHLWHIFKGKKPNFKQAKQEVLNYARKNNTQIPNYFESVMEIFEEERQSDLDEATIRQQPSQRAERQQQKILASNRKENQRNRANSQNWSYQHTQHLPQESIILNSIKHRPEGRAASFSQQRTGPEHLPYFSMLPPQTRQELRPQSPEHSSRSFQANPNPSSFQVKFNYKPTQRVSRQPTSSNTNQDPIAGAQKTISYLIPQQQVYPNPLSPINLLPPLSDPNLQAKVSEIPRLEQETKHASQYSKLIYSDTTDTYELDEQIAKDIMKYFGSQQP